MSLADVQFGLSKKLKNLKSGNFKPVVKMIADESNRLESIIPTVFSSSNINCNASQYKLLKFWDGKPKLQCTFQISASANTDIVANLPYLFDQRNSSFDPFCLTKMIRTFALKAPSETIKYDETMLNPLILSILSLSFDKELMERDGYTTEFLGLQRLFDHYSSGCNGIDLANVIPFNMQKLVTGDQDTTNVLCGKGERRSMFNIFKDVLNNPNRIQFEGAPTFTCAQGTQLYAQFSLAHGTYVPCIKNLVAGDNTSDCNSSPAIIAYSNGNVLGLTPAVQYGRITQTWSITITEPILMPCFSNPFMHGSEKPFMLGGANFNMTLELHTSYVQSMFKIASDQIKYSQNVSGSGVNTLLTNAQIRVTTFETNLLSDADDMMRLVSFVPNRFNALPNTQQVLWSTQSNEMKFTYSYKPNSIDKYVVVAVDPQWWDRSVNWYGDAQTSVDSNGDAITQRPINTIGGFDLAPITDFNIIVNNKNILQDNFSGSKSQKMLWLRQCTSEIMKGRDDFSLVSLLQNTKSREYLNGDVTTLNLTGENVPISQTLKNCDTGFPFLILDMTRLLNLYDGNGLIYPLCNYSTGEIAIEFQVSAIPFINPSETFNLYDQAIGITAWKDGFDPASQPDANIVLSNYQLQLYGLKCITLEQDYNTLALRSQEVVCTADDMVRAYGELADERPHAYSDIQLYGNGWFDDLVDMGKKWGKRVVDFSRKVKGFTDGSTHQLPATANKIATFISDKSKDLTGYGRKPRRI